MAYYTGKQQAAMYFARKRRRNATAAAPTLQFSTTAFDENAQVSSVIAVLSVADLPDGVTVSSYAITADPDAKFDISGSNLILDALADYETATTHSVTVEATLSDASTVSATQVFDVVDIEEVAAELLLSGEDDGFAADFTYSEDTAKMIGVKASGVLAEYEPDAFITNAGTSPKLVYDATGTLVWSPHNMATSSGDFTGTGWSSSGTPVVTATTLEDDDSGATEDCRQTVTSFIVGATYTVTIRVLKDTNEARFPDMGVLSGTNAVYQLNTKTGATTSVATGLSSSASAITDPDDPLFWRFSITFVPASTSHTIRIAPAAGISFGTNSSSATGAITATRFQLNRGTVPTDYLATTTAARYGLALDHDPATLEPRGLLVEPAATNLATKSSPANVGWTAGSATINENAAVSPTGRMDASTIVAAAGGNTYHSMSGLTAGTTYTASWFAKLSGFSGILQYGIYDATNGAYIDTGSSYSGELSSSSYFRKSVTFTTPALCTSVRVYVARNVGAGFTGTLTVWGLQVETGSIATSPIPTFGAAVTRAADVPYCGVATIPYSATAGTVLFEWVSRRSGSNLRNWSFTVSNSDDERIDQLVNALDVSNVITDGAALQANIAETTDTVLNTVNKTGFAWAVDDGSLVVNAGTPRTDAVMTLPTPARLYLGCHRSTGFELNGHIRKIIYLPRRMSNADLQLRTAA